MRRAEIDSEYVFLIGTIVTIPLTIHHPLGINALSGVALPLFWQTLPG